MKINPKNYTALDKIKEEIKFNNKTERKIRFIRKAWDVSGVLFFFFCLFSLKQYNDNNIFIDNVIIFIWIGGLLYQFLNKLKENFVIVLLLFSCSFLYLLINPYNQGFSGILVGLFLGILFYKLVILGEKAVENKIEKLSYTFK